MERTKAMTPQFQRTKSTDLSMILPRQGDLVLFIMEDDTTIYKGLVLEKGDGYYKVTAVDGSIIIDASTQVRQKHALSPRTFYRVTVDEFGKPSCRITHIKHYKSNYQDKRK